MVADKTKIHFALSNDALAVIDRRAPSPGKRGEWISLALLDYDRILSGVPSADGACGTLEAMEARLSRIEKQLSLIVQRLDQEQPVIVARGIRSSDLKPGL